MDEPESDRRYRPASRQGRKSDKVSHQDIKRKLKFEFSFGLKDDTRRHLESIHSLLAGFEKPEPDLHAMLQEAAETIYRLFKIREIAIGLRNPADGLFRYEVFVGYRKDAEEAHRRLAYNEKDFFNDTKYKATDLSRHTRIYFAEDSPYVEGEETSYNRPVLLKSTTRTSDMDSLEGDYIDVLIRGVNGEIVGWIEFSGTVGGKIPSVETLKWIETIAMILGVAVTCRGKKREIEFGKPLG